MPGSVRLQWERYFSAKVPGMPRRGAGYLTCGVPADCPRISAGGPVARKCRISLNSWTRRNRDRKWTKQGAKRCMPWATGLAGKPHRVLIWKASTNLPPVPSPFLGRTPTRR